MISLFFVVLASVVPGLLWVWFFYRYDRFEPEPKQLLYRVFVQGMAAVFLAGVLEMPVRPLLARSPSLPGLFLISLLGIGLVEEGVKLFVVYRSVFFRPEFDEVMDGIIYATTAGLGFASLETFLYIFRFGLGVAPARALLTTLAHASFTGLAGYYLGLAKLGPAQHRRLRLLWGLALAALLHGLYDFLILSQLAPAGALLVVMFSYSALATRIRQARRISPFRAEGDDEG
ncbi:MAG: PrsW family glutamic-type intramembrane protease [Bacillota bacterium]|nr:PrsW family glutamic-type intramembrane protease [Bacillota bacterium]